MIEQMGQALGQTLLGRKTGPLFR